LNKKQRTLNSIWIQQVEVIFKVIGLITMIGMTVPVFGQDDGSNTKKRVYTEKQPSSGSQKSIVQKQHAGKSLLPVKTAELGIFPAGCLNGGWISEQAEKLTDQRRLFEIINGEADKFIQEGFKTLHQLRIRHLDSAVEIQVELYDQGNLEGSLGLFSEYMSEMSEIRMFGEVVYLVTTSSAIGRKGRFFFRMTGSRESDFIRQKLEELAKTLAALPENEADRPLGYRIISRMGVDSRYITHQSKNVFQFDFAENFWFGNPDATKPARIFIHHEHTSEKLIDLYHQVLNEQRFDYRMIKQENTFSVLQHRFLNTWFGIGHKGLLIFGVENEVGEDKVLETLSLFNSNLSF